MATTRRFHSKPMDILDSVFVGIIVVGQFFFSLFFLLVTPFMFNYGGAAAHPNWFLTFILVNLYGIVSACFLSTRRLAARLVDLLWHALFIAYVSYNYATRVPREPLPQYPNDTSFAAAHLDTVLWLLYFAAVMYLIVSAFLQWQQDQGTRGLEPASDGHQL
jgi:hypothetical protein